MIRYLLVLVACPLILGFIIETNKKMKNTNMNKCIGIVFLIMAPGLIVYSWIVMLDLWHLNSEIK